MAGQDEIDKTQIGSSEQLYKTNSCSYLEIDNLIIYLLGKIRIDEEGVSVFRVDIPSMPPLYGEWKAEFESNGNDFSVLITSFGYGNLYDVGNMLSKARVALESKDEIKTRDLVAMVFSKPELTSKLFPFGVSKARFLGEVVFAANWTTNK